MKKTLCTILAAAMILSTAAMAPASAVSTNASSVSAGQNQVDTPLISNIENTADGVKLSWNAVDGAYKYRVYYQGKNGWTKFAETTGTTAIDSVVTSGKTYTYTIRCVDKNGKFASGYNANGWKHKFVSVAPQITNIENTEKGVKLSWGKVAGAYKYRVYYQGKNGWTKFAETRGTTALDDVVRSGKTYTYTVRCLDKNNNFVSGYNTNGWKQTWIAAPKITKTENTDKGVKLSWNAVDSACKYRVYYKGKNGWKKFAETTGTSAIDDVVTSGSTYTYTLRALDKNGKFITGYNSSGWKHKFVSVAPQITEFENTSEGVKLSWNKVAGAYKYRVYYKGRNGWTRFAETKGTTAVDDVVTSGKTYTYTVRAVDKNGNFASGYNANGWKHTYVDPSTEPTVHNHSWVDITESVKVVDKEAYTYEEDVFETQRRAICNDCGADISDNLDHIFDEIENNANAKGSYSVKSVKVKTGTKTIYVPEESHYETKVIGRKCSTCGETVYY